MLGHSPVLAVLTLHSAAAAVAVAAALARGGVRAIEVTLRTPAALEAIAAIARDVSEVSVGAGTVRTPADLARALEAGAAFAVSPGHTPSLLEAAGRAAVPFLPGVATASEVMACVGAGFELLKFFPAAAAGGIPLLRSLAAPFPDVHFCPTGGIGPETARAWLDLPQVLCVGGSWLVPDDAVAAADWHASSAWPGMPHGSRPTRVSS